MSKSIMDKINEDALRSQREWLLNAKPSAFKDNGTPLTDAEIASRDREFENSKGVF